ncbi:DUF3592 domain-containing protein [Streptomonospora sp. S1-112]|uniref:DUF3592 domain-containing protein n=1 Tax=Streptomonospora mangrovi TaxID=2883123 RepID=A0A9X3NSD4_9ACTN|nr:DUF3592 domain-containing protein [Streptomonospora mangrovi]MDA0567376.1 DUF3592 domain-containing protein [Streptomonospora mangrovi]
MIPPHHPGRAPRRRLAFLVGALVCGGFALILLVIGIIFFFVSRADYSDHTGRAEAVVSDVVVTDDTDTGPRRPGESGSGGSDDIDVYVDYTAEGQQFTRAELSGLNPSDYSEGETLTVAYDPADPGDPVTAASTEPGAFRVFGYIGMGLLAGGAVAAIGAIAFMVSFVRRR